VDQSKTTISYRIPGTENGPIILIKKRLISKIEYKNAFVDLMGNQNPRKSRPLGISEGYAFSKNKSFEHHLQTYSNRDISLFTSTIDYFIIPQVDLELTFGSDSYNWVYFATGGKVHFNSDACDKGITPFTGISFGSVKITALGTGKGFMQIPLGINYLSKFGLDTSISGNILFYSTDKAPAFLEFRVGWKFKI